MKDEESRPAGRMDSHESSGNQTEDVEWRKTQGVDKEELSDAVMEDVDCKVEPDSQDSSNPEMEDGELRDGEELNNQELSEIELDRAFKAFWASLDKNLAGRLGTASRWFDNSSGLEVNRQMLAKWFQRRATASHRSASGSCSQEADSKDERWL